MGKLELAKKIISHYGHLPTKEEIKKYVLAYNPNCSYNTSDILKAAKEYKQRCNYKNIKNKDMDTIKQMYKTMTAKEIAEELGMTLNQVEYRLEKGSIEKQPKITKEEMMQLYPKYTLQKIAEIKGISYFTVQKYSKLYGIVKPKKKELLENIIWSMSFLKEDIQMDRYTRFDTIKNIESIQDKLNELNKSIFNE